MNRALEDIIRAVCRRNWQLAESYARTTLVNMKSERPADVKFRDEMLGLLDNKSGIRAFDSIPVNLQGILTVENPAETFLPNRYYVNKAESDIADTILKIDRTAEQLSKLSIHFLNASLLTGESGTGKTTFARYVAYKLGIPLVYVNFTTAVNSYLGSTSSNIERAFAFVKPIRCVLMLDELDSVAMRRGGRDSGNSASSELNRITISLMRAMDSMPNSVLILAATNRPDVLDEAVARRFFLTHEVERVGKAARRALAESYFNDVGFTPTAEELAFVSEDDMTQAEVVNRIVRTIVNRYTNAGEDAANA